MDFIIEYKLADGNLRKVVIRDAVSAVEALNRAIEKYPDIDIVLSIMPSVGI